MATKKGHSFVYLIRAKGERKEDIDDIFNELTYAVWSVLKQKIPSLNPHMWVVLSHAFANVFKNRLVFHKACGGNDCWSGHRKVFTPHHEAANGHAPKSPTALYILEINQDAERFIRSLTQMTTRLVRHEQFHRKSLAEKQSTNDWIRFAIRQALSGYFFQNELCHACDARRNLDDRRTWQGEK